ncbi:hypothetical protein BI364_13025 [Acidihalobacter yilgarnensis]|uniref:Probable membrane transporter protein n=1 Tax=Acidihalobacter yilgarnensis TaxID=2819280 RepID=A0A1D8IQT7_9GAMM|nr:sulfite exporter TauE/SafE family protein [Acidihalobacter yilgarnensis]AOU98765.1 hypothetical protein BI364_13025 [Acidihalobacter yilgarnensis]
MQHLPWFADLSLVHVALLLATSFAGSLMTASLGIGGGAFLLAVMAGLVPPLALIPVHGLVQMGSNAGRAWMTREHASPRIVGLFTLGGLLAAPLTVLLLGRLAPNWIPLFVGLFLLALTWLPMPRIAHGTRSLPLIIGGFVTTLATVLVGATGPLVSAWLGRNQGDRWTYTANFSSCMTLQHALKLTAFALAGFSFLPWLPLLALMIACGYLGTLTGLKMLGRLPDAHFKPLFRLVMTLLAARAIWTWASGHP